MAAGNINTAARIAGAHRVLGPTVRYGPKRKEEILRAYQERPSLRGVSRTSGVSRPPHRGRVAKKNSGGCRRWRTLAPAMAGDVLELDEVRGYVGERANKAWTWTALCRRTRQIVAYVNGDRSEATCRRLWHRIPEAYRGCRTFSDFWKAYARVFSEARHLSVSKETGETAHMGRWNNTLRQRVGRMVRKTLSFSKDATWHDGVIHWFVVTYNSDLSLNV